jgi:MoaA/NifB/PqqE/SkfB family radical SAM enzyme/formylglycine-generating enzyme required for sulfatase activity
LAVNWMVTYGCLHRCRYCLTASGRRRKSELSLRDKLHAIEVLASLGVRRLSLMGGEPFRVDGLATVLRFAHAHGVVVNLTTGGDPAIGRVLESAAAGVQYVNVSLDGTRDLHEEMRGAGSHARAIAALESVRAAGVPTRVYAVLTRRTSSLDNLEWLVKTAHARGARCLLCIFFSPTGRGRAHSGLRVPLEQRPALLSAIADRTRAAGLAFKHCDPYEPEMFKVFLDSDGTLYTHRGRGRKQPLGHIFERPDGSFWDALALEDRRRHWDTSLDLLESERLGTGLDAPSGMAHVAPGVFRMGGALTDRESPVHCVYVDGFFVDRWQTTNAEYAEFLSATRPPPDEVARMIDLASRCCSIERVADGYRARPGFEGHPVVEVSWAGAAAFAHWRGKRLPTEAEWEKVARAGCSDRTYPWGESAPASQCNWRGYDGSLRHLRPDFHHGRGTLPVGSFPPNELGVHDLAGNVWEWCADWYEKAEYRAGLRVNPTGPANGTRKVLRGGSWSFDPINLRVAHRAYAEPTRGYPYDGFRCVLGVVDAFLRAEAAPSPLEPADRVAPNPRAAPDRFLQCGGPEGLPDDERCRFRPIPHGGLRVVVRLTHRCNMACPHCLASDAPAGGELSSSGWDALLRQLPQIGARKVLLTGGEPTLRPDLVGLVELLSALGIATDLNSNLQTVGRDDLHRLRGSGLTEISTSLEGPEPLHDRVHACPGAFARTIRSIRSAVDVGVPVDLSCCLTRTNLDHLSDTLDVVRALPVRSLTLARVLPIGHGSAAGSAAASPAEYLAAHERLRTDLLQDFPIPVRLVGLTGPPAREDCGAGRSLVGFSPSGGLVPCVLMPSSGLRALRPLEVGLTEAIRRLRCESASSMDTLCW